MSYDIDAVRANFPALSRKIDGKSIAFLDNPAGTQVPRAVVERMTDAMFNKNANLGGSFSTSLAAEQLVADAHRAAELFLGAPNAGEVFLGQSMTTLTFAMSRTICADFAPGDEIILTRMDHDANVAPWLMAAEDRGLTVHWLDFSEDSFEFDLGDLRALITERTRLIAFNYASNVTGTINDVAGAARIARECGAQLYVDAVQFAPHGLVDVAALGCDYLVCSAYKFFGPHYAVLWGRRERLQALRAYKVRAVGDALPGRFTTGTTNREELAGVHAAIDYLAQLGDDYGTPAATDLRSRLAAGYRAMKDYEDGLTRRLIDGLQSLKGVRVLGITDPANFSRRVSTVSFTTQNIAAAEIASALAREGIQVWDGHNYALEIYRKLGLLDTGGGVRIGPVHYNTIAEVDRTLERLDQLIRTS
ncbi:cysteine desulfurase-like protein [Sphingomonas sp. GlSt437]|uniref:cysteine desulfurase-like protein n=1 Tax=Sphingomonas sp. GlSt437 TaxID=3389970 RepID=UPI003A864DCF